MADDQDHGGEPSVDELEGRLTDIESAMNQLQAAELDPAESTINALAEQIEGSPSS